MLKIISLKRSIETNTKINLWVGGEDNIRSEKMWPKQRCYRDQTTEHDENFMAINLKTYIK